MTDRKRDKPWSEMDLFDLKKGIERGEPIDELAAFLLRDVEEVRRKVTELELATPCGSKSSLGGL